MAPVGGNINWLGIGEAAKYLGVSRDTLRRWEKRGRLKSYRTPGGRRRYTKYDLELSIKPSKGGYVIARKPRSRKPKPAASSTPKAVKKHSPQHKPSPPPKMRSRPSPSAPKRSRTSTFSAIFVTLLMIVFTIIALLALTGVGDIFPLYLKPVEGILKPLL